MLRELAGRSDFHKPPPLPNLTALRFFAAMLVLGFHLTASGDATPHGVLKQFFMQGFVGVPLFFVLSGFVLAYSHDSVPSLPRFYLARFARVYPLCLFALSLVLSFTWIIAKRPPGPDAGRFIPADLLLLQAWVEHIALSGNSPAWTLSVEAFLYFLFPVLLPFVTARITRYRFWIVAAWIVFLVPPALGNYRQLAAALGVPSRWSLALQHHTFLPPLFLGEFLMGMFAGAHFRRAPRRFGNWAATLCTLLAVEAIYWSAHIGYQTVRDSGIALPFLLLIYVFAGWESALLSSRPLQLAGEISFSIYLLQAWVSSIFETLPAPMPRAWEIVPTLLLVSIGSYLLVEKPARLAILQKFHVRAASKPIPTATVVP